MDSWTLLDFRLINSIWRGFADKILLERSPFELCFIHNPISSSFILKPHHGPHQRTLADFNNCLQNSRGFPMSRFGFAHGDLSDPHVQEFFSKYGEKVKTLWLNLSNPSAQVYTKLMTLRKILLRQAPNIQNLYLESFPSQWSKSQAGIFTSGSIEKTQLPQLKRLKFFNVGMSRKETQIQVDILKVSSNLERISYVDLGTVDQLISSGQIGQVKDVVLDPSPKTMECFEKFCGAGPKLSSAAVFCDSVIFKRPELWSRMSSSLSKFIESSQDSLELFHLFYPIGIGFLSGLNCWPQLKKVSKLNFTILPMTLENLHQLIPVPQDHFIFPPGISLSSHFPSLHQVTFNCHQLGNELEFFNLFPFGVNERSLTVKKLEIFGLSSPIWMNKSLKSFLWSRVFH